MTMMMRMIYIFASNHTSVCSLVSSSSPSHGKCGAAVVAALKVDMRELSSCSRACDATDVFAASLLWLESLFPPDRSPLSLVKR